MKTVGIIAEYNPLHKGHLHHISKTRSLLDPDILVVIVSSFFSQRGLPSLISRQNKAKLALKAGADLVLELPAVYACQSADYFALYAVESLKAAGVQAICFGSETNDIEALKKLEREQSLLQRDPSTSLARSFADQFGHLQANDILGLQYVRWCRMFGMEPVSIARDPSFKSATATRADFFAGKEQYLQSYLLKEQNWNSYYPLLRTALIMTPSDRLKEFFLVEEGIENRLKKAAWNHASWDSFLQEAISKTYTRARIQRTCLFILLQVEKKDVLEHHSFFELCVLGMNEKGAAYLKTLPKGTPIYTRQRDLPDFLKSMQLKTRFLYSSVLNQNLSETLPVYIKETD
ncbi:MAG: nucleotidyltransferase family protein [Ileibacterium sp.]|nr:nucleotidyltransferase family protein [Ileibacterium sp.]